MGTDVYSTNLEKTETPIEIQFIDHNGSSISSKEPHPFKRFCYNRNQATVIIPAVYENIYKKFMHPKLGIHYLDCKVAKNSIPTLLKTIEELGYKPDIDPNIPTIGNAGYLLTILLYFCDQFPEAEILIV